MTSEAAELAGVSDNGVRPFGAVEPAPGALMEEIQRLQRENAYRVAAAAARPAVVIVRQVSNGYVVAREPHYGPQVERIATSVRQVQAAVKALLTEDEA